MTQAAPQWYAVLAHAHSESKAVAHLERQGFQTYFPRYLKRRRHARRVDTVAAPLFPRYLFVAIDIATQRWRAVQSTFGVVGIVRNGESLAAVPPQVIGALKEREDERGFIQISDKPRFTTGDRVRVIEGVFSNCFGLFEGSDQERVSILLDLLGRKVRVTIDDLSVAAV